MKSFTSWLCACLMTIGSVATVAAYAPLPQDQEKNLTTQLPEAKTPQGQEQPLLPGTDALESNAQNALVATIRGIDRQNGVLYLQTEFGNMLTWAEPETLQNLHAGDQVVLYVLDDDPEADVPQDAILT